MNQKTVLLVDDEQGLLEALADALEFEGYRVLKATNVQSAIEILERESVDLATVDIMIPPGEALENKTTSRNAGIWLCEHITRRWPKIDVFCLSVVSEESAIRKIESFGVKFLRKGETPLRTVLNMMRSRLTGIAYSTDPNIGRR
ncbi:MAG: response regulator [Bradyrhizobiaceae bacterium]|nr:MAG: response regulator [Bradyrhizobiaceae bacterium]